MYLLKLHSRAQAVTAITVFLEQINNLHCQCESNYTSYMYTFIFPKTNSLLSW